jgi:hypothetical protein
LIANVVLPTPPLMLPTARIIYIAFLAFRQPYKVVTPYKRHTLYVTSRKFTMESGLRYKIIWADGFAAPDGQPYGLTTGAWTTLRVAHNPTAPATMKESYLWQE